MKNFKQVLSLILVAVMLISSLSVYMTASADEGEIIGGEEVLSFLPRRNCI